jgi:uncharacterized membrane protein YedE/YeeE
MLIIAALAAGLIFGIGLIVSGMANPAKVLGFLDVTGNWDPSLALVMVGAIGVGVVAFAIARRRPQSLLQAPMRLPTATDLDGASCSAALRSAWAGGSSDSVPARRWSRSAPGCPSRSRS